MGAEDESHGKPVWGGTFRTSLIHKKGPAMWRARHGLCKQGRAMQRLWTGCRAGMWGEGGFHRAMQGHTSPSEDDMGGLCGSEMSIHMPAYHSGCLVKAKWLIREARLETRRSGRFVSGICRR